MTATSDPTPRHLTELPAGLTARPLAMDDARGVYEVMAAQQLADVGEVVIEEADIVGDWQRPSYDVSTSAVGVFDGDRLVGYAEVMDTIRGDAAVHPDYRGRGVGTWLAHRMQDLARSKGSSTIGMPVPEGSAGDRLLDALGYHVRWHSWVLHLPEGATIPARPLPEGYAVREARPEEYRAVWTVIEDAFLEWSKRERSSFEDWSAQVFERPGFEPWNIRVVVDASGEVVGAAVVLASSGTGYIDKVATRSDRRGLGLGQVLLVDAFAVARAHGCTRSELATDSRTGALSLYEKVGMVVRSTWVNRAIEV